MGPAVDMMMPCAIVATDAILISPHIIVQRKTTITVPFRLFFDAFRATAYSHDYRGRLGKQTVEEA